MDTQLGDRQVRFGVMFKAQSRSFGANHLTDTDKQNTTKNMQGLDWIVQCFTSPPTQYRLYGRRFLQAKRPNQQYQSTEENLQRKSTQRTKKTQNTHTQTHKMAGKYSIQLKQQVP